jgi:uncharacterized protein YndB with AHSA1/START domain
MTAKSRASIRLTETFPASAERVFDAWLSPEKMARWFLLDAEETVTRVEIDARVGGSLRVVTCRAGRAVEHTGEYLQIERPHRLSFTIGSSASARSVRITVRIKPCGAGCCLTLTSAIERPALRAPFVALAACPAENVVRPRWPTLQAKAALSLGLHLAMLPVLLIALREPATPGAGAPPALAMVTVDLGAAAAARPPQQPHVAAAVAPPAPPATQTTAVKRALPLSPSHTARPPNGTATNQAASASTPTPQALNAAAAPPRATSGAGLADTAPVEPPLAGTICAGIMRFSPDAGVVQARQPSASRTYYGGEEVPVEVRFFRDHDGKPWIRFTLWPEAPWDLPVRVSGSEIGWTDVEGSGYALRRIGNNRLTGLAGLSGASAAKIDFTCAGSDAHHT